jgi:hypothetical protein
MSESGVMTAGRVSRESVADRRPSEIELLLPADDVTDPELSIVIPALDGSSRSSISCAGASRGSRMPECVARS